MSGWVPIAWRNLSRQRLRLALSVGGVGMALLMILALDGIYAAILDRVTAYPDNQGAPLIASQRGVSTMHMSSSTIPRRAVERLQSDPRVERAEPILYTTLLLGRERQAVSYVIGFRGGGGPWEIVEGRGRPRAGEIVLDERTADRLGLRVGSRVGVLGSDMRVVGLAGGADSVLTGLAFVDYDTFARAAGTRGSASYVLVWPRGGDPSDVARALERDHRLTVQTARAVLRQRAPGHLRHEHRPDPRHADDRDRRRSRGRRRVDLHRHRGAARRVRRAQGDRHVEPLALLARSRASRCSPCSEASCSRSRSSRCWRSACRCSSRR